MGDYERGVIDGMRERIEEDLERAAMSIAVLEEELDMERAKKWNAVRKLKLLESLNGNIC